MVRSGYSFVAVEVKVQKYNKTLNVRSLGRPVSFVFPRVLMFPKTMFPSRPYIKCIIINTLLFGEKTFLLEHFKSASTFPRDHRKRGHHLRQSANTFFYIFVITTAPTHSQYSSFIFWPCDLSCTTFLSPGNDP